MAISWGLGLHPGQQTRGLPYNWSPSWKINTQQWSFLTYNINSSPGRVQELMTDYEMETPHPHGLKRISTEQIISEQRWISMGHLVSCMLLPQQDCILRSGSFSFSPKGLEVC